MLRFCSALVLFFATLSPALGAETGVITGAIRVIDADTIDVAGQRIRLHGIDAPEMDQTCQTAQGVSFHCGLWAKERVAARFAGQMARCVPLDRDRYGRIVARCGVGRRDMGQVLVEEGWAFAFRRYSMAYDLDEKGAAINDRGLHALRVQSPAQFRKARTSGGIPTDPNCRIKGNISSNGRIFHSPGQAFYAQTGINPARGERWFCSAAEARAAGWRAAKR